MMENLHSFRIRIYLLSSILLQTNQIFRMLLYKSSYKFFQILRESNYFGLKSKVGNTNSLYNLHLGVYIKLNYENFTF